MKYNIRNIEVYGIIYPLLNLDIDVSNKCKYINIKTNKKIKTIDIKKETNNFELNFINVTEKLSLTTRKVVVELILEDEVVVIYQKQYNCLYRLFKLIKKPFRVFFLKIYVLLFTLARNVKYIYIKYRFLVPLKDFKKCFKKIIHDYKSYRPRNFFNPQNQRLYLKWIKNKATDINLENLKYKPLISIVLPIIDTSDNINDCINSITSQLYDNYELLIISDKNVNIKNNKIKFIESKSKNMSELFNLGIENMNGEYLVPISTNNTLEPNHLYECVRVLNYDKTIDFIYSDEDRLDSNKKRCNPRFKPDYSPDTLLSFNYIGYVTCIKKNLIKKVGLYDFILQCEKASEELKMDKGLIHRSLNVGFSGGEKKKNEVLQMKLLKPSFVILDELDSGLDVDSVKIVAKNILEYKKENPNTSILIITHLPKLLEYLKPDYVHLLINGNIYETGDYQLAKKIEDFGYNDYLDKSNIIKED